MTDQTSDFRHKEAFALMWYACDCGHRERIWNSRDGVTPFGCCCPSCGEANMRHVDFGRDYRAENHVPHKGQRVWRDGTPDEAAAIMKRRVAHWKPEDLSPAKADSLIQRARNGEGDFFPGWPTLVVTTEEGNIP